MNKIIEIKLNNGNPIPEELQDSISQLFTSIIDRAKQLGIWDKSITSIIITDNLQEEVTKKAKDWNIKTTITRAKDYYVSSKVLFNHKLDTPEHALFFQFNTLMNESSLILASTFSQILIVKAKSIIPREVLEIQFTVQPPTLDTFITVSAIEWCKSYFCLNELKKILKETNLLMDHNLFLTEFKRSLKRSLFECNSDDLIGDERIGRLWNSYSDAFHRLFLRVIENFTSDKTYLISEKESCRNLIYDVEKEIHKITSETIEKSEFDISGLKQKIIDFSNYFGILLKENENKTFRIELTKNPKDYFKGELVDTEPRIVCFLDILGFKEFIEKYENDMESSFLQKIQESFILTNQELLGKQNIQNQEFIKHLEYKTFSDNICISIPYFDNESDFLSNFNLLSTYVRAFQILMMSQGFFTRGGISIGSYYADDNIIFSQGMVNAYQLENKKAIYPRTIIDRTIIEKILTYSPSQVKYFGLTKSIILDWENNSFLNPFGFIDSSLHQFNSVMDKIDNGEDDPLSSVLRMTSKITTDLLAVAKEAELKNIDLTKKYIEEYLEEYKSNEHVYSKYLWLKELLKWIENDDTKKLNFQYLEEILNQDK